MKENIIEISYKDKTYIGYILTMEAIMEHCTTMLGDDIQVPLFYNVTLLPYDVDTNIFRNNERVTVIITHLSQIKPYDGNLL